MLNSDSTPNPLEMNAAFNPFMNPKKSNDGGNGFNVDDLVKRIDAKIAELEEEERQEKAKLEQENKPNREVNKNEEPKESNPEPINGITDDQFFDDFFSDE